jgi:hypothetical protein
MNSEEQSQDFEKLQHLLRLKRYEQPPPRYFNDFSSNVMAHIRADTSVRRLETADDLISRTPWLRRLWRKLESQPGLSGALATVACGLMVAGVFFMEETNPQTGTLAPLREQNGGFAPSPSLGNNIGVAATLPQAFSTNVSPFPNGLNLFEQTGPLGRMQPVSHRPLSN